MTEPPEVVLSDWQVQAAREVAAASDAGDEARVMEVLDLMTADDRAAVLGWCRRSWWIQSEIIATKERIREIDEEIAKHY